MLYCSPDNIIIISNKDHGVHSMYTGNAKISQYAWISTAIDKTCVTRSIDAIGRDFQFTLDFSYYQTLP